MIAVSLASGGCAASRDVRGPRDEAAAGSQGFEKFLERARRKYGVPALAAAFVRDTKIAAAAAVGVRRVDRAERVELDDRFHIGSVSKPVSATVIATLVEQGLLGWETTVAEVFPDLAHQLNPAYRKVTLAQLLAHRAGVVPWEEDEEIAAAPVVAGSPRQQRRAATLWLLQQPPVVEPGTAHVYSNAGYTVAAAMAEEVTDVSWEELVQERLAKPIDLKTVGFGWPARTYPPEPWGHRRSHRGFVPHPPDDSYRLGPLLAPAGDLHMSILDLARFAQLHLEGLAGRPRLLRPETFRELHTPMGDYALGWNVRETADHHLGGAETFIAAIWVSVPRRVAVVVASNSDADTELISAVINQSLRLFEVPRP